MDYLTQSLDWLLEEEGGFSNHPSDRGGATMYGVTQATYDGWRNKKGRPRQPVGNITKDEAYELYQEEYWNASGCDKLPWPISYLVFDAAVNSGVSRGVRWMQQGIGVSADGKVGPHTLSVAQAVVADGDTPKLLAIVDARVQFLSNLVKRSPSQAVFLLGWWRRTQRVLARALLERIS